MLYFREGYSLLLHGVGSKRNLINDFHNEIIADHPTLIINGFFPSLTLKDVSEPMKLNMCVCVCVCSIKGNLTNTIRDCSLLHVKLFCLLFIYPRN